VRLGDVTPAARLRLDSLTRYSQDVSNDDTTEAGLSGSLAWVVRRTRIDVLRPARLAGDITVTTFCSGLGSRWAERHLSVSGSRGGRYEVSTLWISVDAASGRPQALTEEFLALYAEAAGGRRVTTRLTHPKPPSGVAIRPWPLRVVDYDIFSHVNNAAYWAVVEEALAEQPQPEPFTASVEYATGLPLGADVSIAAQSSGDERLLWWLADDPAGASPTVAATARLAPLAG
jgi:acyl-ACP thioesterase